MKVKLIKRIAVYDEEGYYDDSNWIEVKQELIGEVLR
jgi:hypothetical protein